MKSTALFRSVTGDANRFDSIVRVLAKYGLADWIRDWNLEFVKERFKLEDGRAIADMPQVERVRLAFTARLGLTLLLSFVALPVLAQKVNVDLDRDYAFGDIDSYLWTELDQGELSGSAHDRITATVEMELDAAGLSKAEPGDVPDVLVTYLTNTTELPVDADDRICSGVKDICKGKSQIAFPEGGFQKRVFRLQDHGVIRIWHGRILGQGAFLPPQLQCIEAYIIRSDQSRQFSDPVQKH